MLVSIYAERFLFVGAMRVVKYFSYEIPFLKSKKLTLTPDYLCNLLNYYTEIYEMRKNELKGIRVIQIARSAKYVSYSGCVHPSC